MTNPAGGIPKKAHFQTLLLLLLLLLNFKNEQRQRESEGYKGVDQEWEGGLFEALQECNRV